MHRRGSRGSAVARLPTPYIIDRHKMRRTALHDRMATRESAFAVRGRRCCPVYAGWFSLTTNLGGGVHTFELTSPEVPRCRYLRPASRGESGSVLIRIRKCVAGTLAARNVGSAALLAPRGHFRRSSPHFQLGRRRGYQRRRTSQLGRRRLAASAAALPRASFVAAV